MLPVRQRPRAALAAALVTLAGLTACSSPEPDSAEASSRDAPRDASSLRPTIPAGTEMTFTVNETVSSADVQAGDSFTSTLTADVAGVDGRPALPAGAQGRWVVTEARDDRADRGVLLVAQLDGVQLERAWYPVKATLTSIDLVQHAGDADAPMLATLDAGGGAGGATGTVVALATRGASVVLHQGARISVRLDGPLILDER